MYPADDWQARNDADTLKRAKEIEGDKARTQAATNVIQKDLEASKAVLKDNAVQPNVKGNVSYGEDGLPKFG